MTGVIEVQTGNTGGKSRGQDGLEEKQESPGLQPQEAGAAATEPTDAEPVMGVS